MYVSIWVITYRLARCCVMIRFYLDLLVHHSQIVFFVIYERIKHFPMKNFNVDAKWISSLSYLLDMPEGAKNFLTDMSITYAHICTRSSISLMHTHVFSFFKRKEKNCYLSRTYNASTFEVDFNGNLLLLILSFLLFRCFETTYSEITMVTRQIKFVFINFLRRERKKKRRKRIDELVDLTNSLISTKLKSRWSFT